MSAGASTIPYLDADAAARRLSPGAAVDALEAALRAGLDVDADPPRSVVGLDGGQMLVMASGQGNHPTVKVVTVGGDPRVQGCAWPSTRCP